MLVVSLKRVHFNLKSAFSLPGLVQILHCSLNIRDLSSEPIILATLHLHFVLQVLNAIVCNLEFGFKQISISVLTLNDLLNATDFHLPQIDFVLILLKLNFVLSNKIFLDIINFTQSLRHVFNLAALCVVDICLSRYLFV